MNVVKLDYGNIPPTTLEYYKLKESAKKRCPSCKTGSHIFSEKNRVLSITCATPNCTANIKLLIDSYIPYDTRYNTIKNECQIKTRMLTRKTNDVAFEYIKGIDLSSIEQTKEAHCSAYRNMYDDRIKKRRQLDEKLTEAKLDRKNCIDALKQGGVVQHDLSIALDEIHRLTYTSIYHDVVVMPEFPVEIPIIG